MNRKKITITDLKNLVIDEIKNNVALGDFTAIDELLSSCSIGGMMNFLGDYAEKIELTEMRDLHNTNNQSIDVTNVQVYLLKEPTGKIVALARFCLSDHFQITGMKVMIGANGLFVSYPQDMGYKGDDYRSVCYALTTEMRDKVEKAILTRYSELVK
jgi:stage V sporulation protein G